MFAKHIRLWLAAAVLIVLAAAGWFLTRPYLFAQTAEGILFMQRVQPGEPVSTEFRHSVMFTQVSEYMEVNENGDGLILRSTKYQSNGLGLPFLQSDGTFRQEGDWFIMDDMNRAEPEVSLRNGKGNYMTLTVGDKAYFLPDLLKEGAVLRLYVAPLYKGYWMKKEIR